MTANAHKVYDLSPDHLAALAELLNKGLARPCCPGCGSDDIRERNVAEVWAPVTRWHVDSMNGLSGFADTVDDSGAEWGVTDDGKPYVCCACTLYWNDDELIIQGAEHILADEVERIEWTDDDQQRAGAEGWAMFNGSDIQADDDLQLYTSDFALITQLARRAASGDEFAQRALLWVRQEDPDESATMLAELMPGVGDVLEAGTFECFFTAPAPATAQ